MSSRKGESNQRKLPPLLVLPTMGWFFWFIFIPLGIVGIYSFSTKGIYGGVVFQFQLDNYVRASNWIYLKVFWNSFKLAALTAISCLFIGYPMAYVMAVVSPLVRSVMLALIVIPFWTNLVVRTYAIKVLLNDHGPLFQYAVSLGLIREGYVSSNSDFIVWFGMVTNYLPFMVLPLFVSLEKFDFSLLEAAKDLGAASWRLLWHILIPMTKPGIVTGLLFVFTPALGEFVIPDLLGGSKTMLIGNLITDQFLRTRDWPFGSALSLLLILIVMLSLMIYMRTERQQHALSGERH